MKSKSVGKWTNDLKLVIPLIIILVSCISAGGLLELPATAHAPTTWVNNDHNFAATFRYLRPILLSSQENATEQRPRYLCGFYCGDDDGTDHPCENYFFSVVIAYQYVSGQIGDFRAVWSANPDHPVKLNATLQLTSNGGLILKDVDGTVAWSANSKTRESITSLSLNMAENGSLILFDAKKSVNIWQSFDHPTDTLVSMQSMVPGAKLTAMLSEYDSEGNKITTHLQCYWSHTSRPLLFYIESSPPQLYFQTTKLDILTSLVSSVHYFGDKFFITQQFNLFQFLQLRSDGHLIKYEHHFTSITEDRGEWKEVADVLGIGKCRYPPACGRYGICVGDKQCICPVSIDRSTSYFRPINENQLDQGCVPITPLTCNASQFQSFVSIENVSYYGDITSGIGNIQMDQCKETCLRNCSCKAAIFAYLPADYTRNTSLNFPGAYCHLLSEVFSFEKNNMTIDVDKYQASAFIKVQNTKGNTKRVVMVGITIGDLFTLIVFILGALFWMRKKGSEAGDEDDNLEYAIGSLVRFSYDELKVATADFATKLGQGGFGSVFEAVLKDGAKVAVKRLQGVGQMKKSFLAEVESIGNIHHVNLVKLIGFCAEKSHKFLVYEYMINGSLERWIYANKQDVVLDWNSRRKIVQDVAKGLAYLHEDCRQKIIHLDVKPQNILLDEKFNAKLSDFGLAKIIDRDESKVVTIMRGTPGYLAPEWLSGIITEKVDVYSFGVVLLEILGGRKHFEAARPEESQHLLKLVDLVDNRSEDMLYHSDEVVEMMKIAARCLVTDSQRRPSMAMVNKVLEGALDIDIEEILDYNLMNTTIQENENQLRDSITLLPSILTGPR